MRLGISAYLIAVSLLLVACEQNTPITWAGYVEEDSIDVSSEVAGKLKQVFVSKGQTVNTGEALFQLDENPEKIQVNEAQARIATQDQKIIEAKSQFKLAQRELQRTERLAKTGISSQSSLDTAHALQTQTQARYQARKEELNALQAAKKHLTWILSRKHQIAPTTGIIDDIWYEPGNFIAAGKPVLRLRPEDGITLRFFVPETKLSQLKLGSLVQVSAHGIANFSATVSGIAAEPEFTPPVLYAEGSRSKLMFWIEAKPESKVIGTLHPGLPIDVSMP